MVDPGRPRQARRGDLAAALLPEPVPAAARVAPEGALLRLKLARIQALPRNRPGRPADSAEPGEGDRKSTRLNSSHVKSSYAVFCLKKEKLAAVGGHRG